MLRWCVLSEVSKERLMCNRNVVQDISLFAWSINLTLWWAGRKLYTGDVHSRLSVGSVQLKVTDSCYLSAMGMMDIWNATLDLILYFLIFTSNFWHSWISGPGSLILPKELWTSLPTTTGNHIKPVQTSGDIISGVYLCANLPPLSRHWPIMNDRQPDRQKGLEPLTATVEILKNQHTVSPQSGVFNLQREFTG